MKIAVSIEESDPKTALSLAKDALKRVDLALLKLNDAFLDHLDLLKNSDLSRMILSFNLAKISLDDVLSLKPAYLDIPFGLDDNLNKKFVHNNSLENAKIILTYENKLETPSLEILKKQALEMHQAGADVVKIVTHAQDSDDSIKIIALADYLKGLNIAHCLHTTGQAGVLAQLLTPSLGGEMMFAILDKNRQTALGQLTVNELRQGWSLIELKS